MATSSKFDPSSSSPDRPLYTGQRGSHIAASLDRSGSFRESMGNPILSSLPNMSRSCSSATHGDVSSFFKCVHFDQKLAVPEHHKSNRQMDYKQHVCAALGVSPDESPRSSSKGKLLPSPVPEDIKRLKDSLHASQVKARERVKMFNEALSVFNKVFPSITSKKRSRGEGFSNGRCTAMLSDRPVSGPTIGKAGVQDHPVTGAFEFEQQKSEERAKNIVPNRRIRTSLVDVRMDGQTNSLVRPSGTVDRDKEVLRIFNSDAVQGEERTLSIGGDGWEKSKMKKKRSCIKLDGSPSTTLTKPVNTFQETKQRIQQRVVTDARSKLNNDSHSSRSGVSNGTVGAGKLDGISQQTGLGIRASTLRNDHDSNSLCNDRRGRPVSTEKERVIIRAVNKTTIRDEFSSDSPIPGTKINASIRAPRSGSGVAPKLSPVVHRTAVPNDWELSQCTTKSPAGLGNNNRKRVASARSSSPPVVHWQRPQKSSRTARRTNLVPTVLNNDEAPTLDAVGDVAGNDIGLGFPKRLAGSSPQKNKLKGDLSSSVVLSESEESAMGEAKPREKGRKSEKMDQKAGKNIHKVSNLVLPIRKNKLVSGEERGDGVRRQGRTRHSFTATRSLMPMTSEKLRNIGTAKQLRSARLGLEKNESKAGRPPTRKLSDRKAYAFQNPSIINVAADFLVGSEDGHEELLAAVKGLVNSIRAFSSPFWKQMECFFSLISEEDIGYWKQKVNLELSTLMPTPVPSNIAGCETMVNGFGLIGCKSDAGPDAQNSAGIVPEQLQLSKGDHNVIPLCQRFIAALISEEDCSNGTEDFKFDVYDTVFEPEGDMEFSGFDNHLRANFQFACGSAYNSYRINGRPEHDVTESGIVGRPSTELNSSFGSSINCLLPDKALKSSWTCSELQFASLDINDKLLLELQSIGIAPEPLPEMIQADDEGILEDIARLEEQYRGQISKKKGFLDGLLKSASIAKELQEKDFEQRALEKLVVMAYEKYMACWGPSPSGGKNSINKIAKQAASGFVKRTLDHCHQFEGTGKSCFKESSFKDIFLAATSQLSIVRQLNGMDAESSKPYASPLCLEAITASMGSQQSPSQFSQNMDNHDLDSSDMLPAINHSSEQTSGNDDLWSNRVKKRELSLDDVGDTLGISSTPGIRSSLASSVKGKRSERDRDGKGHSREVLSRNGTTKIGKISSGAKGERKSKAKAKQKATQHSVSVNGLVGKLSEQPKPVLPSVSKSTNSNANDNNEFGLGGLDEHEPIDLSNLQLPGMDVLCVPDDDQGQDLGSWLNIDDDGLHDNDFMGLEIPMDDLTDLNMMV
ncbi:hypothetical protein TanjilG_26085 [Lupinus angustifolius]|uniref:Uncharacterized protein n=1 Tax=Lupinus angustifolius TaxID=3871 RepID=A0A4P1R1T8_LUPAN|nr:PREDICTED: uncharacterized protein LOC109362564 isoform X1 [Lupinus angustifolius]XP_019463970.1 PREDICTED: uncharacterized protein LOC109362564 isoform X1 [Lupinus angustifolius]OIV99747.1 hypothetical protein TanjilG_26085 [Lupinus angustifolius]